jgi:hypothetical protein
MSKSAAAVVLDQSLGDLYAAAMKSNEKAFDGFLVDLDNRMKSVPGVQEAAEAKLAYLNMLPERGLEKRCFVSHFQRKVLRQLIGAK